MKLDAVKQAVLDVIERVIDLVLLLVSTDEPVAKAAPPDPFSRWPLLPRHGSVPTAERWGWLLYYWRHDAWASLPESERIQRGSTWVWVRPPMSVFLVHIARTTEAMAPFRMLMTK